MQINNKTIICFRQAITVFFSVTGYINLFVFVFHRAKETEDSEDNFIQKEVSSSLGSVGFRKSITDEEVFLVFSNVIHES